MYSHKLVSHLKILVPVDIEDGCSQRVLSPHILGNAMDDLPEVGVRAPHAPALYHRGEFLLGVGIDQLRREVFDNPRSSIRNMKFG